MASAQLTIAKAGLLAALLKPDLVPCPRDEIEQLHGLLSAAAARCSPANVQVWNTTTAAPMPHHLSCLVTET